MTDALATFMLARIAEDEQVARATTPGPWRNGLPATIHPDSTVYRTVTRGDEQVCGSILAGNAEHIACHDPARVLAECEAKLRIVAAYKMSMELVEGHPDFVMATEVYLAHQEIVAYLAAVHREHPDYRSEWLP